MTKIELITEALANGLLEHIDDYRGTMPGGYDDLDGLADRLASVIAALPNIAIAPSGETTRRYSAAYRDTFGKVVPVGVDYRKRAWVEEVRDEWKRDDPNLAVFIAYRDEPEWQEADQ